MSAAAADTVSGDHHLATAAAVGGCDSACSTPFVSAPSSPARDAPFPGGFFSAPASPAHHGGSEGGAEEEYGCEFEFDFSSRFPSPAPAAMSSADELFHNGQIRPMQLASFLLRPQAAPPPLGGVGGGGEPPREEQEAGAGDERGGRLRCRSVHRRSRSHSPFRTWLSPSPSSAPAVHAYGHEEAAAAPSASRSSSSSSTASSASSSSSRSSRRWRFLKDLLHRSSSDGGKNPRPPPPTPPPRSPAPKTRDPSPAPAAARGLRRRSAHERLYAARRAEVEEMRRRTFLPYQQGLLFGCLGLGSRLSAAAAAKSRS